MASILIGVTSQSLNVFSAPPDNSNQSNPTPSNRIEVFGEDADHKIIIDDEDISENRSRINIIESKVSDMPNMLDNTISHSIENGMSSGSKTNYIHKHVGGNGSIEGSSNVCHTSKRTVKETRTVGCTGRVVYHGPWDEYGRTRYIRECSLCGDETVYSAGASGVTCGKPVSKTVTVTYYDLTCPDTNKIYGSAQIFNANTSGGVLDTILYVSLTPAISTISEITAPDYGIDIVSYAWSGPGITGNKKYNYVEVNKNGTYTCSVVVRDRKTGTNNTINASINVTNLQ